MKPVLLGMNNPVSSDPRHALFTSPKGCTGNRLWLMSGLEKDEYLDGFERRNVLDSKHWNLKKAREAAPALRAEFMGRTVILLGAPVNSLMRGGTPHELAPPFVWTPDGHGGWRAKVPHPSGQNLYFNDPLHRHVAGIFLQETLEWCRTHEDPGPPAGVLPGEQSELF